MQNTISKTQNPVAGNLVLFQSIERELKKIFNDDESVIIKFSDRAIHKMALFLSGLKSCSIGIAGETASGKSTITQDIIETLESFAREYCINDLITRINTDDYYYDRSDMVKAAGSFAEFAKHYDLDVPDALELELMKKHIKQLSNGKSVYLPEYDMSGTAIRKDNAKLALPSKIIISEGLFTLTAADAFDFKIYVDVSTEVQKERFYSRAQERGLGSSVDEVYKNASEKAQIYIRPTMQNADVVLSGEADRKEYKIFVNKILNLIKKLHYNKVLTYIV